MRRLLVRMTATASDPQRPLYSAIHRKLTEALAPSRLVIVDTSRSHSEHEAMRGQGFTETHFEIDVESTRFQGKTPVERHRMVYSQLKEEFSQGLHAVSIKTRLPESNQ